MTKFAPIISCLYKGYTNILVLPCFQNYMERIQFSSWTVTSIFNIYFSLPSSWISRKKKRKIQSEYTVISFIYQARCFPSRFTTGLRNIANINLNVTFVSVRVRACMRAGFDSCSIFHRRWRCASPLQLYRQNIENTFKSHPKRGKI
jgi:hypothetical protein